MLNVNVNIIGSISGGTESIPFKTDAFFYLNGIVIDIGGTKYFKDASTNTRNFLITNYDFDSTWTKGFSYKTAATISAPAGDAILIAADINNFLYDSEGTPNQIPVNSLFQDIDYEHKLFCRHVPQVLDSNGVETYEPRVLDIVLYANVKSGADLTTCQSYFGVPVESATAKWIDPVNGIDATTGGRDGSTKAKAWKSTTYTETQITSGTVYITSGTVLTVNGILEKAIAWKRLGYVRFTGTNTGVLRFNTSELTRSFTGIIFDGQGARTNVNFYTTVKNVTFEKCRFINPSTNNCTFPTSLTNVGNINFNDCVFINTGTGSNFNTTYATNITGGYYFSNKNYSVANYYDKMTILYAKFTGAYATQCIRTYKDFDVRFCKINNTLKCGFFYNQAVNTVSGCKFNNNIITGIDLSGAAITLGGDGTEFKNNTIVLTGTSTTGSDNQYNIITATSLNAIDLENNIIDATASGIVNALVLNSNNVICQNIKIKNNIITLRNAINGMLITLDGEASYPTKFNGFEISGNKCYAPQYYGGTYGTSHGIFIHANTGLIDNNEVFGNYMAFTIKGEESDADGLIISNNTAFNCPKGITISGTKNIVCSGNLLDNSQDFANGFMILVIKNAAYKSTGCSFANNQVYFRGVGTFDETIYYIDHADNLVDFSATNNIYSTTTPAKFANIAGSYKTFAEWQALGYD